MMPHLSSERTRIIKRAACIAVFLAALILVCRYTQTISYAAVRVGTVQTAGAALNVRNDASASAAKLGSVSNGSQVTIVGEKMGKDSDGAEIAWYQIQYGGGTGYVSGEYIVNVRTVDEPPANGDYVNSLVSAGFPQSYAVMLSSLHAAHPNWQFEPVATGLEWSAVIEKESVFPVNMVSVSANDSWKSTDALAYDWAENAWKITDGSGWVAASPAIISYYMDPRNFLNETDIYQFETLQYAPYQNEADVSRVLAGTFMAGALRDDPNKTYAAAFMDAGSSAKVNPSHLAARCKQEQGKGTSPLISGTYAGFEGYYNYFNIGAYGTPISELYRRGLTKAKDNNWKSAYTSIVGGASYLAGSYINLGQNTLYFQKFNVTNAQSGLYRHQYMANVGAADSEGRIMGKAYGNKEQAFVFRIPVYRNMPESPCPQPSDGNPNNWLKSLSVEGQSLTPAFQGATTEYSLIVAEGTSSIKINGSPVAGTSSVSGIGDISLNIGENIVRVACISQSGVAKEYIIRVIRQGTALGKGDVNGDGKISLLDMVMMKRHILNIELLTDQRLVAADINGDGKITLQDMLAVKRHILGYESIR